MQVELGGIRGGMRHESDLDGLMEGPWDGIDEREKMAIMLVLSGVGHATLWVFRLSVALC